MDYKLFRFKAVVDFVEIEIQTAAVALGGKMHEKCSLGPSYVTPIDPGAGNYATGFKIRLHDLGSFADLKAEIARIESAYPFARPPIVTMIEVAFDAYLKKGTNNATGDDLAMLAARMACFVANPVERQKIRRYHDHKAGVRLGLPPTVEAMAQEMSEGRNYMSGDNYHEKTGTKQDDQTHHCYFKTTDRAKPLPLHLHRARFEPRLAGAALPHQTIEAWQGFKFESLAEHFKWRKEGIAPTPLMQLVWDRPGASHRKDCQRHAGTLGGKGGGTRAHILPADKPLNDIAIKCLQNLTRGW